MPELPQGTVTFLFTDIEGSTRLWERFPEAMEPVLARHDTLLRTCVVQNRGAVVKTTGDGFHVVFARAQDGVAAALAAQRALAEEPWDPTIGQLLVRMALHTGTAEEREGDYYGPAVNRAARLMSAAYGGQVLLSQITRELVLEHLPESASTIDLGQHRLKDLSRPEHIFQLVTDDLPSTFPPLRSLDITPTNLPVQTTPVGGREGEFASLSDQLRQPDTPLQTKLYVPPLRQNLVPRPHLIERLNQGLALGCKLTLISAPAGFGKTTLVSEWVGSILSDAAKESEITNKAAWLSLDEGDSDPTRFLTYLVAALQTLALSGSTKLSEVEGITANIGEGMLAVLQSPQPPPIESILTALLNEIATIPDNFILVLDDYHSIVSSPVDEALAFLLEHLPPQMHLVIATRDDPQLHLARLRARGQLTELRATDLRFTSPEAADFLTQMMGLNLSKEDISALETRTEGWIAGLQLAAISMQGSKDATGFIKSFTGSHRYVLDYLIEEVLEQQSESVQNFLLKTSILSRVTGSLCDALTGQNNGQATLETLEHANLFIIPLDDERHWYRYHHLFADLLRQRLHQTHSDWVLPLHHRASEWYEQNGFADEAIEHSLHADDFERAAHLIEEGVDTLWGRGEHAKLRRWLIKLPIELVLSRPYICIFHAWYLYASGQLDEAEQTLQAAEQVSESSTDDAPESSRIGWSQLPVSERMKIQGRAATVRAFMGAFRGDVPGIIQHARQALEYLPEQDLTWRSIASNALADAHVYKGDMKAAYEARLDALKACKAADDIYLNIVANLKMAIILRSQGQLQRTIEICQQQMQFANEFGLSQTRIVGWLATVWGEVLAELSDLDGAIDKARKGVELTERGGDLAMIGWSYMSLMRILFSRGDMAGVEEKIQKMENVARESKVPPWFTNLMATWQAQLWLIQEKLEAASQWATERRLDIDGESRLPHEIDFFLLRDYILYARILIAHGQLDEATNLLQHLLKAAEMGGRTSRVIEILILQALASQARGDNTQAMTTLERALTLAESGGFVRIFVDEGPPIETLIKSMKAEDGRIKEYVRKLLAAFADRESHPSAPNRRLSSPQPLIEPLSDRELEVLHLIEEGLSNREIGLRLYLSPNTIKRHANNIYEKLGVHSRTEAVAKARILNILD